MAASSAADPGTVERTASKWVTSCVEDNADEESVGDSSEASTGAPHSSSSNSSLASASRAGRCTRRAAVKACLNWAGFLAGILLELYIHLVYGFSKDTFEAEEECELRHGDLPNRCSVLTLCEIVCRVCLTVVLASMTWEFICAAAHSAVALCLQRTFAGHPHSPHQTCIPTMLFSTFICAVGVWSTFREEDLPLWADVVCHVSDAFCHGIILSALLGICFDAYAAAVDHRLRPFAAGLLMCYDTIEAHGVTGDKEDHEKEDHAFGEPAWAEFGHPSVLRHQSRREHRQRILEAVRTVYIWVLFLATLAAAVLDSYFPDLTPEWVSKATKLEGCFCWAGIAWWICQSLADWEYRLLHRSRHATCLELAWWRVGARRSSVGEGGESLAPPDQH